MLLTPSRDYQFPLRPLFSLRHLLSEIHLCQAVLSRQISALTCIQLTEEMHSLPKRPLRHLPRSQPPQSRPEDEAKALAPSPSYRSGPALRGASGPSVRALSCAEALQVAPDPGLSITTMPSPHEDENEGKCLVVPWRQKPLRLGLLQGQHGFAASKRLREQSPACAASSSRRSSSSCSATYTTSSTAPVRLPAGLPSLSPKLCLLRHRPG